MGTGDVLIGLAEESARASIQEFVRAVAQRFVVSRARTNLKPGELERRLKQVLDGIDQGHFGKHVAEAMTWARAIQVQGMPGPVATATSTIGLDMAPQQRRFRDAQRPDETISEHELVETFCDVLVLGDPGA